MTETTVGTLTARLLIVGPPGAGKGTQASRIAAAYGIPAISTGDIFRANIREQTPLGVRVQAILDAGDLVPDALTNDLVADRIVQPDTARGFLLDGYPRTEEQVKFLDAYLAELGTALDAVIQLVADEDEVVRRLLQRGHDLGRTDDTDRCGARDAAGREPLARGRGGGARDSHRAGDGRLAVRRPAAGRATGRADHAAEPVREGRTDRSRAAAAPDAGAARVGVDPGCLRPVQRARAGDRDRPCRCGRQRRRGRGPAPPVTGRGSRGGARRPSRGRTRSPRGSARALPRGAVGRTAPRRHARLVLTKTPLILTLCAHQRP